MEKNYGGHLKNDSHNFRIWEKRIKEKEVSLICEKTIQYRTREDVKTSHILRESNIFVAPR